MSWLFIVLLRDAGIGKFLWIIVEESKSWIIKEGVGLLWEHIHVAQEMIASIDFITTCLRKKTNESLICIVLILK